MMDHGFSVTNVALKEQKGLMISVLDIAKKSLNGPGSVPKKIFFFGNPAFVFWAVPHVRLCIHISIR
jgi:hypothetical protein